MALSGDLFGNIGGAVGDIFGVVGAGKAAKAYGAAAQIADLNAKLADQSSRVQQKQAERQVWQGIGGQRADVAGAGFASSGSALDLLRSSQQQGALQRQLLQAQGLIDVNSYKQEAIAYRAQQEASKTQQKGGFLSGALKIGAAALSFFSDEETKQDITYIGPSDIPGIDIFLFRYRGNPTIYQGVVAQQVLAVRPDAVEQDASGLYKVNYDALGIEFKEVA